MPSVAGTITLASDDGLEYLFLFSFYQSRDCFYPSLFVSGKFFFRLQRLQFLFKILDSSERLTVLLGNFIEELFYTEHIPVIGHCNRVHAVFLCLVYQSVDRGLPIQQGILGMDV